VEHREHMLLDNKEKDGGQCNECNVNNSNANQAWNPNKKLNNPLQRYIQKLKWIKSLTE
jgi:hypothetical protein